MTTPNTPNAAERPSELIWELRNYLDNRRSNADEDALLAEVDAYLRELDSHHPAESVSADYPECSGDPACCPENEGFGCCKPNPQPSTPGAVSDALNAFREAKAWVASDSYDGIDVHGRELLERADELAKVALESFAKRSAAAKECAEGDPPLVKLAAMLQALEMEPAAVNLSAQQLAIICAGITRIARRASAAQPAQAVSVPEGAFLIIGYGESDIPDARYATTPEEIRAAFAALVFGDPKACGEEADSEIEDLVEGFNDPDEWSGDGRWSITFEIGGINAYRLTAPAAATREGKS